MTDTTTYTIPNDTWATERAQLRARYKHVREPILVALNILLHDPNITLDDAKARAAMRGAKIAAASVNAAQRLLARQDEPRGATVPTGTTTTPLKVAATERPARLPQPASSAETLIRDVVQKLQGQGNAEAERLRAAMRGPSRPCTQPWSPEATALGRLVACPRLPPSPPNQVA